ncbi:MAG: RNA polymerase sigma factor SigJ [Allosphingosinicella sp.]|uniref:RNA polymerase sigma factor SigJ n=1 Tax=Allosphingosinicella sp. TaxID=2823234 RepID=UPI00392FE6DA
MHDQSLTDFEEHRRELLNLAYRMLGSFSEAEDVVQESWLRWQKAVEVEQPASSRAYLRKIVSRLCLDYLKSARARRELYVGPWLPEPVCPPAQEELALERDISFGFMLALERLAPKQRAAFILHDIFELPFCEVAETIGASEAAARQLAARARRELSASRSRFPAEAAEAEALTQAFLNASRSGDAEALKRIFAEDVRVYTDGGGVRPAALNVIEGRERAKRLFLGLYRKFAGTPPPILYRGTINASPGFVTLEADNIPQATALEIRGDRIGVVYIIRNPEKLKLIARAAFPPRAR